MANPNFDNIKRELDRLIKNLPAKFGAKATEFISDNFRAQSFTDSSSKKWPARNSNAPRNSRALLVDSGRLRKSFLYKVAGNKITIYSTTNYASVHNEGFSGNVQIIPHSRKNKITGKTYQVKGHSRKMNIPQRRFFGSSQALDKKLQELTDRELRKIFNV
jgi:phage gpG-like protein